MFFKQLKNLMGFKGYQMHSALEIERFWLMLLIPVHYLIVIVGGELGYALRFSRSLIRSELDSFILRLGASLPPTDYIALPVWFLFPICSFRVHNIKLL